MRNRRKGKVRNDRWKEKSALYLLVFLFFELQMFSKLSVSDSPVVSRIIFRRIDASFLFLKNIFIPRIRTRSLISSAFQTINNSLFYLHLSTATTANPTSGAIKLILLRITRALCRKFYGRTARTLQLRRLPYYCSLRNPHCCLSAFNTLYCLFYNQNDALLSAPDKLHAALYL